MTDKLNLSEIKKYDGIDGLRTISCIAIIVMHVQANVSYNINDFFYNEIIPSWKWLIYLFMMVSAFGLCCGYFIRFKDKSIDYETFYKRRYKKILPFFGMLIFINLLIEHTGENLYEALIELTMTFGLLPNNDLNVIGVSWFLGLIFLFYMIFPFFCFLLSEKKRAWAALIITIGINYLCTIYFFSDKFVNEGFRNSRSFLYCAPFFVVGGIIYLYRETIEKYIKNHRIIFLILSVALTVLYYVLPDNISDVTIVQYKTIVVLAAWLSYAISVNSIILGNKIMKYLSNISMEMYLAQMLIFRLIEKLHIPDLFGDGRFAFIISCVIEIIALILFVEICKKVSEFIKFIFLKLTLKNKTI